MQPRPLYQPENLNPAFQLRYTWSAWPSRGELPSPSEELWESLKDSWESDGLRVLETSHTRERILVTFSARPDITPILVAARAKGRLQHGLRRVNGVACKFSRKVAVRSIGDNRTADVQNYIERQVERSESVDPEFQEFLRQFTVVDESVDLALPTETASGRYWYNLHLVLVIAARHRLVDKESLTILRDQSFRIAAKKGHAISALSVQPDHLHVALRGNIEHSAQQIALAFQNNLAYALNQGAIWQQNHYVGTFGEYNMNAVRPRGSRESASPATQGGRGRGERQGGRS